MQLKDVASRYLSRSVKLKTGGRVVLPEPLRWSADDFENPPLLRFVADLLPEGELRSAVERTYEQCIIVLRKLPAVLYEKYVWDFNYDDTCL